MRTFITTIATLSLGTLPIAAQNPVRPAPPPPPAAQGVAPQPLTAEQRQQQQAIREKYTKELQAHRDAIQATNEKLRAEIDATLSPEQRAMRPQGGGRGMGMGIGGQPGADIMAGPPQDDIYAQPGGMMRRRAQAMMNSQPYRGGRTIIIMTPKEMRQFMRSRGIGGGAVKPKMKRGGGMMGGKPPKASATKVPPAPPKKGGGGTEG